MIEVVIATDHSLGLTTRNSLIILVKFDPGGEKLRFDEDFVRAARVT
jgi:hypothetical protein